MAAVLQRVYWLNSIGFNCINERGVDECSVNGEKSSLQKKILQKYRFSYHKKETVLSIF